MSNWHYCKDNDMKFHFTHIIKKHNKIRKKLNQYHKKYIQPQKKEKENYIQQLNHQNSNKSIITTCIAKYEDAYIDMCYKMILTFTLSFAMIFLPSVVVGSSGTY